MTILIVIVIIIIIIIIIVISITIITTIIIVRVRVPNLFSPTATYEYLGWQDSLRQSKGRACEGDTEGCCSCSHSGDGTDLCGACNAFLTLISTYLTSTRFDFSFSGKRQLRLSRRLSMLPLLR